MTAARNADRLAAVTAFATIIIALAALLSFGAAIWQYRVLNDQYAVFQEQLNEMKGASKQTDQLIKTAIDQTKATQDLARAATNEARASQDSVIELQKLVSATQSASNAAAKSANEASAMHRDASRNFVAEHRARISVVGSELDSNPELGQKLTGHIDTKNTGIEPARMVSSIETWVTTLADNANYVTGRRINSYVKRCFAKSRIDGGGIIIPSTAGSPAVNETHFEFAGDDIDQAVMSGTKILVMQICGQYSSGGKIYHFAYCFAHQEATGKVAGLTRCEGGDASD